MGNEPAAAAPPAARRQLERRLELRSVVSICLSAMLGSGVFVLPGLAAGMTGPSVWMAYIAAGLCVLPAGLAKAELSTAMPASGGTYVYVERTFGPLFGTVVGLGLWLSMLLKSSFALDGFAAYLEVVASVPAKPTALVLLALIIGLNIVGVRKVGKAQSFIVSIAFFALLALAFVGLTKVDSANLSPLFTGGFSGFATCVAFVFVSYAGVTKIAAVAEEVANPNRNLPLGILLSLLLGATIYGLVVFTLVGNIPVSQLQADLRPVHTLAEAVGGSVIGFLAAILGVLTMTSMANVGLLSASRFPFAMSRDGLLPNVFAKLHPGFLTPVRCIVITGVVIALTILTLDVEKIAKLASSFILIIFMIENLVVLVLRESGVQWYQPPYRMPLYPLTPIAGVIATLGLLYFFGVLALVAGLSISVPGLVVFLFYSRKRTQRVGVLGKLGPRQDIKPQSTKTSQVEAPRLSDSAAVQVALLGHERSPETLVEMGAALADGKPLHVLHVTEVPDQTTAEAVREDDAHVRSLRRRMVAMSEDRELELAFESLVSRDVPKTIHEQTAHVQPSWLVVEWRARSRGSLLLTTPLGWLTQRLTCNLAVFRDAGVRYIRNILALVEPGPHDALVASTADHLAEIYRAELTLARWVTDKTELPFVQAQLDYLDELRGLVQMPSTYRLIRGEDERVALVAESASYDLIVLGAPPEKKFLSSLRSSVQDRLNEFGGCSVLQLRTPRTRAHDDEVVGKRIEPGKGGFRLIDFVESQLIVTRLRRAKKEALFETFAKTFAAELDGIAAKDCVQALWAREKTQNTSVGEGVAMPHATLTEADRLHLAVFTLDEPMDYEAIDGRGVDVFFVTLGPPSDRQTHLRVLGGLAGLVLQTDMLDGLRGAEKPEDVLAVIERATRQAEAQM